jgi:hypothetical protein
MTASDDFYLTFEDETEDAARARYRAKFNREPERVIPEGRRLYLGPVPVVRAGGLLWLEASDHAQAAA